MECVGCCASASVGTIAGVSVYGVEKNKTYINNVDIYDEREGPVRTRMKDDYNPS